jgi:CheY-like chemotaxis protein
MKKEKQSKKELENEEISRTRNSLMLELLAHAEAETQLRESEEKYRNLVSSLPEGIFSTRDITEKRIGTLEKDGLQKEFERSKKMESISYAEPHKIDLVALDMNLPVGLNGWETYEQLLLIDPKIKAIITSGQSMSQDIEKAKSLGAGDFIKKPYSLQDLGLAVQKQLLEKGESLL